MYKKTGMAPLLSVHLVLCLCIASASSHNISGEYAEEQCGKNGATEWVFVRGLHHGGTTLTANLIGQHPLVSQMKTGVKEDEGQVCWPMFYYLFFI